jgi:hypothetical protein
MHRLINVHPSLTLTMDKTRATAREHEYDATEPSKRARRLAPKLSIQAPEHAQQDDADLLTARDAVVNTTEFLERIVGLVVL